MSMTAADLITQLAERDKTIGTALTKVNYELEDQGKAGEAAVAAQTQIKDSSTVITQVEELGKLASQEATSRFASELGTNPATNNQAASILHSANESLASYYTERDQAIKDIEAAGPPSFMRRFVNAKLQSKGISTETEPEFRARVADAKIKSTTEFVGTVNRLTQEAATTQKSIAPTMSAASVEAQVSKVAAVSDLAAANIRIANAAYNIDGVSAVLNIGREAIGNKVTALQIQEQGEDRKLRREQLDLASQERADRIAQKKETAEDVAATLQYARMGLAALDSPRFSPKLDDKTLLSMIRNKSENPILRTAVSVGESKALGGGTYISDNAGVAAITIVNSQAKLAPEKAATVGILKQAYSMGVAGKDSRGQPDTAFDGKDKNAVIAKIEGNARAMFESKYAAINPADSSNPYMAPRLPDIMRTPALASIPFVQKIVKPAMETGMNRTEPDMLMNQGIEAIAAGSLKLPDVTFGINALFNQATRLNNATQEFQGVGARVQTDYNAVLTDPSGNVQTVDLTDPVAVNKYVMKRLANRRTAYQTLSTPANLLPADSQLRTK